MKQKKLSERIADWPQEEPETVTTLIGIAPSTVRNWAQEVTTLEAKLEAMRNAATIAIVALANYSTSDNELDNVREMLEGAIAAAQQEQKDE